MRQGPMRTALAVGAALLLSAALPAHANFYTFSTPTGATAFDGQPLDATVNFTTNANGTITVQLINDQTTVSASQLLSDVSFHLSGGISGGTLGGYTPTIGSYINVDASGNRTSAGTQNLPWTLTNPSDSNYHFTGLGNPHAQGLIIGPSAGGSANASINGSVHNPYLDGTATFTLAIAGVTVDTIVSAISLSFGTNEETTIVPIPAAVWLFGSALLGLIGIARRRQAGLALAPA